jgi:hypothetical protein
MWFSQVNEFIELVCGMSASHFRDDFSFEDQSLSGNNRIKEREREREREMWPFQKSDVVTSGSPVANPTSGPQYSLFNTK